MTKDTEVLKLPCEALKEERKRISEYLYEMQGTVSQFATSKECMAYNRALREAAEKIIDAGKEIKDIKKKIDEE